jgi:hypothetical protein
VTLTDDEKGIGTNSLSLSSVSMRQLTDAENGIGTNSVPLTS